MRRRALALAALWAAAPAALQADPFAQGQADASALQGQVQGVLGDPQAAAARVPGYAGTDVPEKQLHGLGAGIEAQGRAKAATDPLAIQLTQGASSRPRYVVDSSDPLLSRAASVEGVADAIAGTYGACSPATVPSGPTAWTTQTCVEQAGTAERTCERVLVLQPTTVLTCTPGDILAEQPITVRAAPAGIPDELLVRAICRDADAIEVEIEAKGPSLSCLGQAQGQTRITAQLDALPHGWRDLPAVRAPWGYGAAFCTTVLAQEQGGCDASSCTFTFRFLKAAAGPGSPPAGLQAWPWTASLQAARPRQLQLQDVWTDTCGQLQADAASGRCAPVQLDRCVEQGSRQVAGQTVSRPCWRYRSTYSCTVPALDPSGPCAALRAAGCLQQGSRCLQTGPGGACLSYEQAFRCPAGAGGGQAVAACAGTPVCIGGSCAPPPEPPAPAADFAKAAAHLGAVEAAAQDFDQASLAVFTGSYEECTSKAQDCGPLRQRKQAGLCAFLGNWTEGWVGNESVHEGYCCFNSRLARIVQEQGRAQLGLPWSATDRSSCRGLSPQELAAIDWSALDLSEVYADLLQQAQAAGLPDPASLSATVRNRLLQQLPVQP